MTLQCNDTDFLLEFVNKKYPNAEVSRPSGNQTKIDLPEGLVMNIYNTGTVNFQGKSHESHIASDIINVIEFINRPVSTD